MQKETIKICKIHKETMFSLQSNGDGTKYYKCKKCNVEKVNASRKKLKFKAIEYKGGKCVKCGYNKCNAALDFHHIDSSTKEFNPAHLTRGNFEKLKSELDKCVLLCSNCHREHHSS